MARPIKKGMDYFPHDTDASNDEKIEALRALYGNDGYAFYFILLERIYRTIDAELNISKPSVYAAIVNKVGVSVERFNMMLDTALEVDCFNPERYQVDQVLTSNGIKQRHTEVQNMRERWRKHKEFDVDIHVENPMENSEENPTDTSEISFRESKVKESKVNIKHKRDTVLDEPQPGENLTVLKMAGMAAGNETREQSSTTPAGKRFDEFWAVYPKKIGKKDAQKAWKNTKVNSELFDKIMTALKQAQTTEEWRREKGRFIPHPASWLNKGRWDDEYGEGKTNGDAKHSRNFERNGTDDRPADNTGEPKLNGFKRAWHESNDKD